MRIIKESRLNAFVEKYPQALASLAAWKSATRAANWQNFYEVRQSFRSADAVGNLTVFNIKGNDFRLIVLIDYAKHLVFVRDFLTHEEYDRDAWKRDPWF